MKRRFLGLVLAVIMALGLLPATAFAAAQDPSVPQVHVIVENTTFTETNEETGEDPAWTGRLVDTWVNLTDDMTMMSAVAAALDEAGVEATGATGSYISEINGLAEMDGDDYEHDPMYVGSGWMGSLNDWFTDQGFTAYTVANGGLQANDVIRVMYTRNMGLDLGNVFPGMDDPRVGNTTLSALSVNGCTMSPDFASGTTSYTVTYPEGTTSVTVDATAVNKMYQVYLFSGETEYRRTASVPVSNGSVLTVRCGSGDEATTYTLTFTDGTPLPVTYNVTLPSAAGYTVNGASTVGEGEDYSFTVTIADGFTGEDMVVKVNGEAVTANEEGVYTVANVQSDLAVTVEGVSLAADGYEVTFQGHSAQADHFEVYSYNDGTIGTSNWLAGVADSDSSNDQVYTTHLPAGDYWVKAYESNGDYSGAILVTVTADGENLFNIQRAYSMYVSNSGWVLDTDYTLDVTVTAADMSQRVIELGSAKPYSSSSTYYPCALALYGDTVTATYTPSEARIAEGYMAASKTNTLTSSSSSFSVSLPQSLTVTITAPAGSTITMGQQSGYYSYTYFDPETSVTNEDGTITNTYKIAKNTTAFYRVQNPAGVTYYQYTRYTASAEVTVTEADLYMNDPAVNANSIWRYDHNTYDRADIYMNINGKGYMDMNVGDTFEINVFRNWMAIESISNNQVALPDTHYTVIDANGQPSDVVTIDAGTNNPMVANMTANHEGTAIVLITYDAMTHMTGMTTSNSSTPRLFSAIWPECAGVFVVTVGAGQPTIDTGMIMSRHGESAPTAIDAEHDILFYVGDEGADFTFAPEEGTAVSVARATLTANSMTYNGFSTDGVTVNADGTVTVSGLTTGRHIIKVEKDGQATYQVVTARGVSYDLLNEDGSVMTEEQAAALSAGDTFIIQFHDLVMPNEKMSGLYNAHATIYLYDEEGNRFASNPGGSFGVYDFSGNPARQRLTVTIPKYWQSETFTLTGQINCAGFGSAAGMHRGTTYARGQNAQYDAPTVGGNLSEMPVLTLNLAHTDFYNGTLYFMDQDDNTVSTSDITRVILTDSSGAVQEMSPEGGFMCVANETYSYQVFAAGYRYATGTFRTGARDKTAVITLQTSDLTAAEGAWDGITLTEPAQDEEGIFQITSGAELAWYGNQFTNNSGSSASEAAAVILNDIDLAGYPWTPVGTNSSAKQFRGSLDGAGHEIMNLNVDVTTQYAALIGYAGNGARISNLTVSGSVYTTNTNAAGLVGYAYGNASDPVVIENCVSNVTVAAAAGKSNVAGIAAQATNTQFINCANHGDVTGANYTAGIVAYVNGATTVNGCYNAGTIRGTGYVGGIMGYNGTYNVMMAGCYNTGDIIATGTNVGGIAGWYKGTGSVVSDVYNIGAVSGGASAVGDLFGILTVSSCERAYSLEGTSDTYGTQVSEEALRSAELDPAYFLGTCDGYPALVWQTDANFHHAQNGVVTEPTCTEGGFTTYTCEECGAEYVLDFVPATGHTPDEAQAETHLTYTDQVCAVCGEHYREYADERFSVMTIDESVISEISFADGDYAWGANDGRLESLNIGKDRTTAESTLSFTLTEEADVSFSYGVSSERNYDKLTITATIGDETVTIANAISGENTGSFAQTLPAGTYTLTLSYTKDSSAASGFDMAWVENLAIMGKIEVNVTILDQSTPEMIQEPVTVADMNGDGVFSVDEALYAAHEQAYEGGAAAGYATAQSDWGLSVTKLWGNDCGSYGYYLNNISCWSLADAVHEGDQLVAWVYTDAAAWTDHYTYFGDFTYMGGLTQDVTLRIETFDESWSSVRSDYTNAMIDVLYYNEDGELDLALSSDQVTNNGDGSYTIPFPAPGEYVLFATAEDGTVTVPAIAKVTVYNSADAFVTISNAGDVVMAMEPVTVYDRDNNGTITLNEALYDAHEQAYDGGAAAGYAYLETNWGPSISKLWGVENGGSYGFYTNNVAGWSLDDAVSDGDQVYAYVYADTTMYSDSYSQFDAFTYESSGELEVTVSRQFYDADADWALTTAPVEGAEITLYNESGEALPASACTVTENGEGAYTLNITAPGTFTMIATSDTQVLVPAVAKVTVAVSEPAIYEAVGAYLQQLGETHDITVNAIGGEWMVIGLVRSGRELAADYFDDYYQNVLNYVTQNINDAERLHRAKSTDNARVILALTALGYDPTTVAGHDLLAGLNEMSYVTRQGINGPIWALLAFDSGNYETPANGDVTREALIQAILDAFIEEGGWALSGSAPDVDMTGMAITALAPYYDSNEAVKNAVDKAVAWLSAAQSDDGGFSASGYVGAGASSESTAWVITALSTLGIDPATDARFVKNGNSAVDALCSYYVLGEGFRHIMSGGTDGMATEQGYYALVAYHRFLDGRTDLFDMTDVTPVGLQETAITSLTAEDNAVTVEWSAANGAKSYIVWYRQVGTEDWTAAGKTTDTTYTVEGMTRGFRYEFRILTKGDGDVLISDTETVRVHFSDVTDDTAFYYDPVYWAADNGITTGWADGTFRPWNTCNRASVVTFLWRLAGEPEPQGTYTFSDPTGNETFDKAITWAVEQGITTGWASDNTFRPWNTCNRASIVTFLWRYAGRPDAADGYEVTFTDMTGNADFDAAIAWAASYGVASGYSNGTFRPWNDCNRASTVTFMYRMENLD